MHKRTLSLSLCIYFTMTISAQNVHKTVFPPPDHFIRLNPTGLLDPLDPNLSLGYEYRFHEDWAVAADLAWVFYSRYSANTKHANGFIFRPAMRRYIGLRKHSFLDAELHYKYVVSTIEDWLGRECVNDVPAFEEFTTFHYLRQSLGSNLKCGEQARISRNNKFLFEYYLGLGLRWNVQKVLNEPHSCYTHATNFTNQPIADRWFAIAVPFGFRLVYRIN